MFYAINILNTIYYFKPTNLNNAFCKFHTFSFFYNVSCLPWFETKNKIAFTHRNLPASEKYIWIIQNVKSPGGRYTHTCCRTFGSGAVTTCFYDLVLSRLGFEHLTSRMRGKCSNRLRQRCTLVMFILLSTQIQAIIIFIFIFIQLIYIELKNN